MNKTPKRKVTRRLASAGDRAYAAELARCYWAGEPFQVEYDGRVIGEFHVDGDALAKTLQHFAEFGTFEVRIDRLLPKALRDQWIRDNVNRLHEQYGITVQRAMDLVIQARGERTAQTVHDAVYPRKTPRKPRKTIRKT